MDGDLDLRARDRRAELTCDHSRDPISPDQSGFSAVRNWLGGVFSFLPAWPSRSAQPVRIMPRRAEPKF